MCATNPALVTAETLIDMCQADYKAIEKKNSDVQIHGRGYLAKQELEKAAEMCESLRRNNKAIEEYLKVIKNMSSLPAVPAAQRPAGIPATAG